MDQKADEPESVTLRKVTEALWAVGGVMVMRNTVGAAKRGKGYTKFGLGPGSSDLVCAVAPYGRWLCIETKRPKNKKAAEHQEKWLLKMRLYGAVTGVCRTPEEALALVDIARMEPI